MKVRMHHFDKYLLSDRNGTYGGNSGDKEGIFVNGEYWIIKYPKRGSRLKDVNGLSYSQTPESEYIGSHIYGLLGYPVHKTALGIRNGHIVVACGDFCSGEEKLVEFRQLKNTYNNVLNEKLNMSLSPTGSEHFIPLNELMLHFQYNPALKKVEGLEKRFWDCVVIDGLINNNDRNNGNWGILRGANGDTLSPVYDNGASFSPNVPEEKILRRFNNFDILYQSACGGITAYSIDGETNAKFCDVIALDIPGLNDAVRRVTPLVKAHLSEIGALIDDIPETFEGHAVISEKRKAVYKKEFSIRFEELLLPRYKRISEMIQGQVQNSVDVSRKGGGYGEIGD